MGLIRVLLVDDEQSIREQIATYLGDRGYEVSAAGSGEEALAVLEGAPADVALVDFRMPGKNGLELVGALRERHPALVVLMLTAYGTVESAVAAMKAGVHDYLQKPIEPAQLELKLRFVAEKIRAEQELAGLKRLVREQHRFANLVGASPAMRRVFALLEAAAQSSLDVLLVGETGTGKEVAARAIHFNSPRRDRPFVAINCAGMAEGLIESELFGHVKGAFTGATQGRLGRIASAEGGTLLLDELSSAPERFQVRLLRVLEERAFSPLGSDASRRVDVRVIAAMNVAPEVAVGSGQLRRDLFYRLNVLRVDLPPLRERREDIPLLVADLLARHPRPPGAEAPRVTPEFLAELMERDWPGNIRELANTVEVALACSRGPLTPEALPPAFRTRGPGAPALLGGDHGPEALEEMMERCERAHLERVLRRTSGNMREASARLGIDERSLRRKVARFGIDRREFQKPRG